MALVIKPLFDLGAGGRNRTGIVLVTGEVHNLFCHTSKKIAPIIDGLERLAGVEPALPRWQRSVLPLDYGRSTSGSGRGIRTRSVCGVKDHDPAAGRSRNKHSFSRLNAHHLSTSDFALTWRLTGWRARLRTLSFRGQSAACSQLHYSPVNLAAQAGFEPALP